MQKANRMPYQFDLGPWRRVISTSSAKSQRWFDRGLNWIYGFNHEEAVVCFRKALNHDPDCAMAWWGIAYASGPFYNRQWIHYSDDEIAATLPACHHAAVIASKMRSGCSDAECELIDAVKKRYQSAAERDRDTLNGWHREYTAAMRAAHSARPDDLDIAALFAEAAVTCTPRQLWNVKTGEPNPDALTVEALEVLERAMNKMEADGTPHPGLLHMYIHAVEMSPRPETALLAADALRGLSADAGHLEHMPAHIYALCGDYSQSVEQSRQAVAANERYFHYAGYDNFYTTSYCHDLHQYMYSAMHLGQFRTALSAADRIREIATLDLIESSTPHMATTLDGYLSMHTHVLVRFGKWRELLEEERNEFSKTPISAAMHAYGRGIGHSSLGQLREAETARSEFLEATGRIPETLVFLNNSVHRILEVGQAMLDGELEYRKRNYDSAFASLRLAVKRADDLNYSEPWAWMHPPRHALGALLAEQGNLDEAESVYRADLGYDDSVPHCCRHPENVWAMQGLLECVERNGDGREARHLRQRLKFALAKADVNISAACFCRGQS